MRAVSWIILALFLAAAGCGFYFKTYRFKGPGPVTPGMGEEDLIAQWGSPLSVQVVGPAEIWKYFAGEPAYGKKKSYYLVWFQNGQVVKWETREEETVPPAPPKSLV